LHYVPLRMQYVMSYMSYLYAVMNVTACRGLPEKNAPHHVFSWSSPFVHLHLPESAVLDGSSIMHRRPIVTWCGSVPVIITDACFEGGECPRLDHRCWHSIYVQLPGKRVFVDVCPGTRHLIHLVVTWSSASWRLNWGKKVSWSNSSCNVAFHCIR